MDADLTCQTCEGSLRAPSGVACGDCLGDVVVHHGRTTRLQPTGRRPPTLTEWDALRVERDRYREALEVVASRYWGHVDGSSATEGAYHIDPQATARAALDHKETP